MLEKPWGFSLFCDDLRPELGGKLSAMGIYQSDMIFPQPAPYLIPKMAIIVMYYQHPDLGRHDVTIQVFLPGDAKDSPTFSAPLPIETTEPTTIPLLPGAEEDQERLIHARIPIIFHQLNINQEGYIRVRVIREGEVFRFGSLQVRSAQSAISASS